MTDRRDEIIGAAVALADEKGLESVSMRAVAERAGVTPMALYPHVGSKAALLDGMVGRLLSELVPPEPRAPQDWRRRLRDLAHTARQLARRHPWSATLLFSRPALTPEALLAVDQIYRALLDAGVPPSQVPRIERLVSTLVLGYAASEVSGRFGPADDTSRGRRKTTSAGTLPGHAVIARWLEEPVDWDAEFDADLDDLLHLIEAAASRRP